jgi:DNA helicase HerA-like ATPase
MRVRLSPSAAGVTAPAQPIVRVVLGMRGYGKTTLARTLIAAAPRVVGHDPRREYDALPLAWPEFVAYVDRMPVDRFRVTCTDAATGHEEELCAWCYALGEDLNPEEGMPGGEVMVLLEEADQIAAPGRESKIFKRLVSQGRHIGLAIVAVSRRPAEVSRFLTANADELYIFRTQEPRELEYLRAFIGTEAAAAVQQLQKFEHVFWTPEGWSKRQLAV